MTNLLRRTAGVFVLWYFVTAPLAFADPIIVSGFFAAESIGAGTTQLRYSLTGARDLSIEALLPAGGLGGVFVPNACMPCPFGSLVGAAGYGGGRSGVTTLDGITYAPGVTQLVDIWTIGENFSIPLSPPQEFTLSTSFRWGGGLQLGVYPDITSIASLVGEGIAQLTFRLDTTPGFVRVTGARYDFGSTVPSVPEPATVLLLGGGALMFSARKYRLSRPHS